jgi:NADH-quinone oxidoreductase subunit E
MLSESLLEKFNSLIRKYPVKRSALIPMLLATQEEMGYLTAEAIQFISDYLQVPEIEVHEVITFYTMLRRSPVGKYHLQVCTNISCLLLGAEEILKHISKKLDIREGEVTRDKLFSLTEVECLGACSSAPAMQINYDYHENLNYQKVDSILDELKRQG